MLKPGTRHRFDLTPSEAIALQLELRNQVRTDDALGTVCCVAGVDVGFAEQGRVTRAAIVTMNFPQLDVVEEVTATLPTTFPYVPGLLSFRELPAVLAAFDRLQQMPDLVLCDGQGVAHPRRFGIAAHLGVLLDIPAIGVGKSKLIGEHDPVPDERGASVPLRDHGETIGAVLRSRQHVRPLYVSIGHRVSLATAVDYVRRCLGRYRLPEPIRFADKLAAARRR
ncbi:MAG: deoxyribonuclease V [Gammaproteobacteria bacterium]